jgi:diguanylate cyclase (GGDEF)-like protein
MDYGQSISGGRRSRGDLVEGSRGDVGAESHLQALRTLHAVTKRVHASLDLTATLDAVARGVVDAAGFGLAAVNLVDEVDGDYVTVAVAGHPDLERELLGARGAGDSWGELMLRAERWGPLYFVDHRVGLPENLYVWTPDIAPTDDPEMWHPNDSLFAPLWAAKGELLGVLGVDLPEGLRKPGPEQQEILALFAEHAAIAIRHARLHSELEESQAAAEHAATHDSLTGLANRTRLRRRAQELSARPGQQVAALVIDLDGFKKINDAHGHEAGDAVLVAVAERLRRHLGDDGVIARTGGDEFVAILSGPTLTTTVPHIAQALREALAHPVPAAGDPYRVGASIGWAVAPSGSDIPSLITQADHAMYAQKRDSSAIA